MNCYTSTIPPTLAEKLKERGMPMMTSVSISIVEDKPVVDDNGEQWYRPTYAEVFDWLMEKGLFVVVEPYWDFANETITKDFEASVIRQGTIHTPTPIVEGSTWHEAANAAIERALTLI